MAFVKLMDQNLTAEELANGEFDGCPATGYMWGLKFYIMKPDGTSGGYVETCEIVHDKENNIHYLEWHPQILQEMLRRLNRK